jgi:tyrosine-protein phosphatase YwqE
MNKASRNVASVNGNQVDLQEVVTSLQADLQLAKEVAQGNFDVAEQLGGALEIAEGKISVLQARVEELEREQALQVEVIAGKETNITETINKKLAKAKKAVNEELV